MFCDECGYRTLKTDEKCRGCGNILERLSENEFSSMVNRLSKRSDFLPKIDRIMKINKFMGMTPYLLVCMLTFYIMPFLLHPWMVLLINIPFTCFVVSVIYGISNKFTPFKLLFPIFVSVLFFPITLILNWVTWYYYVPTLIAISLIGNIIGYGIGIFVRRKK